MAFPLLKGEDLKEKFNASLVKIEKEMLKKYSIILAHECVSSNPEVEYLGWDPEGRLGCCTKSNDVWNVSGGAKPTIFYKRKQHEFSMECINLPDNTYRMELALLSKKGVELKGLPQRETTLMDIQASAYFGKEDDKWVVKEAAAFAKSCSQGLHSLFQFF